MLCGDSAPAVAGPMLPPPADPSQADITLDCDLTLDPDGPGADPGEIALDDDDDDDGEDDMFVIDRKGTSTPRSTPADFIGLNPALDSPLKPLSFPAIAEKSPAPPARDSPAITPAKKFKRRNQAIYGADADG